MAWTAPDMSDRIFMDACILQFTAARYPNLTAANTKDRAKGRNVSTNDLHQGMKAGESAQLNRGVGGVQQRELLA